MKKWKLLMVSILVLCLGGLTGMTSVVSHAEEEEEVAEPLIGEAFSIGDSLGEVEENMVFAATGRNISGITFDYADVRTPNNRTFNGGDGKYHIIVYGGIGTCGNTNSVLSSLSRLISYMDLTQIEINVFDCKGNSNETIIAELTASNISGDIKVCKNIGNSNLYSACCQAAGISGSYTMPIIAYANTSGEIVNATTGYQSESAIQNNIEAMGMKVDMQSSYQVLNITGTADYAAAYQVLELVNKDRASEGLSALTMDQELLESAMQRAAECSLYYSHTRPNGESCFSLSSKMYRENIAAGYASPEAVENAWMNSSGHHANIMAKENRIVGIGVFLINGRYYWAQCFGSAQSSGTPQTASVTRTYNISTVQTLVDPYFKQDTVNLNKRGATGQYEVWVTNQNWKPSSVPIDASSYNWSSDSSSFRVDANGTVTADKWGTANITAENKNNSIYNLFGKAVLATNATASDPGIYVANVSKTQVTAGMTYKLTEPTDMEFSWYVSTDNVNWVTLQDWKENDEWLKWTPDTFGDYSLKCRARVCGNPSCMIEDTVAISFHPEIKGKCQMPYTGPGGGYLIGVETYENPNQSYQYEMLILDCTLLAEGKDAWIYSTGKFTVTEGCAGWTIWQPQYGYYWTLFRVYDASGNMIDQDCYGFVNAY